MIRKTVVFLAIGLTICRIAFAEPLKIAVLGDDCRVSYLAQIAKEHNTAFNDQQHSISVVLKEPSVEFVTPSPSSGILDVATIANSADVVLIVTDLSQGPVPILTEHALLTEQLGFSNVGIVFANGEALLPSNADLISLVEEEVRATLKTYGLPGATATAYFDKEFSGGETRAVMGIRQSVQSMASTYSAREKRTPSKSAQKIRARIYLVTPQESSFTKEIKPNDEINVWLEGQSVRAKVSGPNGIKPGETQPIDLEFMNIIPLNEKSKFIVENDGHLIGAGFVDK